MLFYDADKPKAKRDNVCKLPIYWYNPIPTLARRVFQPFHTLRIL